MKAANRQLSNKTRHLSEMYRLIGAYETTSDPRTKASLLNQARLKASQCNLQITKDGNQLKVERKTKKKVNK